MAINGQTGAVYTVKSGDKGVKLSVSATVDETTVTSAATSPVGLDAAISEVKLDNNTPKVGDEITAYAYDADGNDISADVSWQWYRSNINTGFQNPISNATKQSYTITAMDSQGTVYAWATDKAGNTLKSDEAAVVKATDVTQIDIEGMSGKKANSTDFDVPLVGDVLSVSTNPTQAIADASYQWYRDGSKISGETNSAYVVTEKDIALKLSVKIDIPASAGYAISDDCTSNAPTDPEFSNYTSTGATTCRTAIVTLNKAAFDITSLVPVLSNDNPAVGNTVSVSVPYDKNNDGDTTDTADYLIIADGTNGDVNEVAIVWYRDSVSAANEVGSGEKYVVKDEDTGKAIIAVAYAIDDHGFNGACQVSTGETGKLLTKTTVYLENAAGAETANNTVTTQTGAALRAQTEDKDGVINDTDSLTYQWFKDGKKISGATKVTYVIPKGDETAAGNTTEYSCEVKGAAGSKFTGIVDDSIKTVTVATRTATNVKVAFYDVTADPTCQTPLTKNDATEADTQVEEAPAGHKLVAKTIPADAASGLKFTWYYGKDTIETRTGSSFTVPTGVEGGYVILQVKKNGSDNVWKNVMTLQNSAGTALVTDGTTRDTAGTWPVIEDADNGAHNPTALDTTGGVGNGPKIRGAFTSNVLSIKIGSEVTDVAQVGAKITATVDPELSNRTYEWYWGYVGGTRIYADNETNLTDPSDAGLAIYGGKTADKATPDTTDDNTYTIKKSDLNKKIICVVKVPAAATQNTKYAGSSLAAETNYVTVSTRTLTAAKLLKYVDANEPATPLKDTWYKNSNKDDFAEKISVNSINTTDAPYKYVVQTSTGDVITKAGNGVNYVWAKVSDSGVSTITNGTEASNNPTLVSGQYIRVTAKPDGVNYVGEELSYEPGAAVNGTVVESSIPASFDYVLDADLKQTAFVANNASEFLPVMRDASGNIVPGAARNYIWTVTKSDGTAATGVTVNVNTGAIKSNQVVDDLVITARPKNASLDTLLSTLTFVKPLASGWTIDATNTGKAGTVKSGADLTGTTFKDVTVFDQNGVAMTVASTDGSQGSVTKTATVTWTPAVAGATNAATYSGTIAWTATGVGTLTLTATGTETTASIAAGSKVTVTFLGYKATITLADDPTAITIGEITEA